MREYRGLSQPELAELAEIDKGEISRIESGQRNCTINTLVKIAAALNCVLDINWEPL